MSFKVDNVFHDSDASTIDKAIAGSVITHYVSTLQTLAGHFETAEPNQFAAWYKNSGRIKTARRKRARVHQPKRQKKADQTEAFWHID